MRALSCKYFIGIRAIGLLLCCLLLLSFSPLPSEIEQQLQKLRDKNDLSGWIYLQIQWVAKAPGSRAGWLQQAINDSWRAPSTNEEIQAWQDLLINEGYALLMSGDIVHSTDAYTSAFQWAREHAELADESMVLENILKPLGNNYTRLGDYEQALFIHRKALAIAHALGDPSSLAGTFSNLANTCSNMGRPAESLDYCRRGLAVAKGSSPLRGLLLSEQADALLALGQPEAARQSIRQSIEALEHAVTAEAGYWLLTALQQAGDIYEARPPEALQYYQKALVLEERLSRGHGLIQQRQKAKLFQRIGALYARTGRSTPAVFWLDRCLSVLIPGKTLDSLHETDLYAENTLIDLLFTAAGLAGKEGHTDKALRLYKLSFATDYQLRRELITGSSRERSVSDSHSRYEAAIRTAWDAWKKTGNPLFQHAILEFMEGSKARLLLDEVLQQQQLAGATDSLSNRIRLLQEALIFYKKEALQQPDSIRQATAAREKQVEWDLSQLRKKISTSPYKAIASPQDELSADVNGLFPDDHRVLRSFFGGAEALYIVECGKDGIIFSDRLVLPEGWQDSIRDFIRTWFEKGAGNMINKPSAYYEQAYHIYRQLFSAHPFVAGKEYILLPDGAMSLLPVDALVTTAVCPPSPADWPFVIRQASISYAWSIRTLQMPSSGDKEGISGFFLSDARQLPQLKNTLEEEKGMTKLIKDGKWYKDEKATAAAFRQALQGSAVVHISSHAYSGKDSVQVPHIELYDQPFYLFELKDIRQHPVLVVLSACRTGDGRMVTGEGVQSLARAFTAAGTNAVVAGWWNVNDATAALLMQDFYQGWIGGDPRDTAGSLVRNVAEALRQSKLDWLRDPGTAYQYKLPYYWAALNYAGNPQPLARLGGVTKRGVPAWTIGAIAVLILLCLLFVVLRARR